MRRRKNGCFVLVVFVGLLISSGEVVADEGKDLQDVRERLIRIEERMVTKDELKTEIGNVRSEINNVRSEVNSIRAEINSVRIELDTKITGGFALLFTTMVGLIGFVLWDRRSALAPAIKKSKELEEREEVLEKWKEKVDMVLAKLAGGDVKVADALRQVGL